MVKIEWCNQFKNHILEVLKAKEGDGAVFISISDQKNRAVVVKSKEKSYEASFLSAYDKMCKHISRKKIDIKWAKVDWVTHVEVIPYEVFKSQWLNAKYNYFRKGVAFEPTYKLAFLEQEMSGNAFLYRDDKENKMILRWDNIHRYIYENTGFKLAINEKYINTVEVFDTESIFFDGETYVPLVSKGDFNGQRPFDFDKETIYNAIEKGSKYLLNQIEEDGRYRYGVFSCFNKPIQHYNILRHASSTYALIEAYDLVKAPEYKTPIKQAIDYIFKTAYFEKVLENGEIAGFIREEKAPREIKLGANAAVLFCLSEYNKVFEEPQFEKEAQRLANGIRTFYREGKFVHVLDTDAEMVLQAYKIIYYEGEATFALMKLFEWQRDERWLDFVEDVFKQFIKDEYFKYGDHWLSYASYYLYKQRPNEALFEFNLKNATQIMDFALERETTYATLLELFMATYRMILFRDVKEPLPTWFDVSRLHQVIEKRVSQGMTGYMYPEVAMYFKSPQSILNGFYIRHHHFRIRIDDVEHSLSGYCAYNKYYKPMKND